MSNTYETLLDWQRRTYIGLQNYQFRAPSSALISKKLTILAYFFWNDDRINTEFWRIEFSFLSAFRYIGLVQGILVTNRVTARMSEFCKRFNIQIQVENSLSHGKIKAMCADCCGNLYKRFETDYVLIIQNDGIVVNEGIERFIDKFDYVGAPWPGHLNYYDWFPFPKFGVGNGGLSLRSKNFATYASKYWHRYFKYLPYSFFTIEDTFYCKTLALMPGYHKFKIAPILDAANFSIETNFRLAPKLAPIGFHSEAGFQNFCRIYGTPLSNA